MGEKKHKERPSALNPTASLRLGLPSLHLSHHRNLAQQLAEKSGKTISNNNKDRCTNGQSKQSSPNIS